MTTPEERSQLIQAMRRDVDRIIWLMDGNEELRLEGLLTKVEGMVTRQETTEQAIKDIKQAIKQSGRETKILLGIITVAVSYSVLKEQWPWLSDLLKMLVALL